MSERTFEAAVGKGLRHSPYFGLLIRRRVTPVDPYLGALDELGEGVSPFICGTVRARPWCSPPTRTPWTHTSWIIYQSAFRRLPLQRLRRHTVSHIFDHFVLV